MDGAKIGSRTGAEPPIVFVSYSHKDEVWKDRLLPHLRVLQQEGLVGVWDDRRIEHSQKWYDEIMKMMRRAQVAVCLISADYLASDFCVKEEILYLLRRHEEDSMMLVLVLLRDCA